MVVYNFYELDPRVRQYVAALKERGDTVDVIALRENGQAKVDVVDGVNVYRIQERSVKETRMLQYAGRIARFMLHSMWLLTRKHAKSPYQLIHIHSVPDVLVFAALVPKLLGTAVILDIHDLLPELFAAKFRSDHDSIWFKLMVFAERCSCALADHIIIANDIWQERLLSRSVPADKCTTIRNYPLLTLFKSCSRETENGKFLMTYPGTLSKHQGLEVAIKAFGRVSDRMPNSEFHIYGEGTDKLRLMQLAKDMHLDNRIFFHNHMQSEAIARVMVNTDLAVEPKLSKIPFSNEAASTKILEFMAAGVPIVASRTSIHSFYYDDSVLKYYDSDDDEALAECIYSMWRDPQARQQQVTRANLYVERNHWEVKKGDYLKLVDTIMARRPV
jgi:glycosyltransferase involved in cell wall biosynthesis